MILILLMKIYVVLKFWLGLVYAVKYGVHVNDGQGAKLAFCFTPRWVFQKLLVLTTMHFLLYTYYPIETVSENVYLVAQKVSLYFITTRGLQRLTAGASVSLTLILWWSLAILMVRKCWI